MNNKEIMLVNYSEDKMVRKVERGINKKLCLIYLEMNNGCKRREMQKWLQRVRGKDVLIKNNLLDSNWGNYVMKMNWFDVDSEGRCWLNDGNSEINYNGKINVDEWKKENKELVDSVEKINDGMFEIDYESIMRMEELNK
tara:strand:- start:440 stop:859 length:420 start_codon:yes stop_codon:yes gene_type:complete